MLDSRLHSSTVKILDFTLSDVLLKDNKHYPWIILVPRVSNNITELYQLEKNQQRTLTDEIARVSKCMHDYFKPDKINIGTLGNIVSQLHIHIVARFKNDALWPHSVWQENLKETPYEKSERDTLITQLCDIL